MSQNPVWSVANWEYKRFAKPRDLLISVIFMTVIFGANGFIKSLLDRRSSEEKTIAVVSASGMALHDLDSLGRYALQMQDGTLEEVLPALEDKEFDAVLEVQDRSSAVLHVRSSSAWQQEFFALLINYRQLQRPAEAGLAPEVITQLTEPLNLSLQEQRKETGRQAGTWTVIIVVGAMLVGLFTGFSYVFVAITSEKTQKVTESVLAAITPQQWIDGKIVGLTLVVLANLASYAVGYGLYKTVSVLFLDGTFSLPSGLGDPFSMFVLFLYALLGFGFWFTFFAVIAATISDPNTSSRSSLLFLPFLPLSLVFAGMDTPDGLWMRVLSWIPGLSPTAMPVRLLRGEPAIWEVLLSLVLLVVMVAMFRRAAGRVFGVTMLMTGKEPSFREVGRWMREA